MERKKILSIDGGGTRGIAAAAFLDSLEQRLGKSLRDEFDLIAGASTGGIIAICAGLGIRMETVREFYEKNAFYIFPPSPVKTLQWLKSLFIPIYRQDALGNSIREIFKPLSEPKLSDIDKWRGTGEHKVRIMIPAFDMSPIDYRQKGNVSKEPVNYRPRVYYSNYIEDLDEKLEDIILRTTAGPVYLPIYQHYADGGISINHPAMSAVAFAINKHEDDNPNKPSNTETSGGKPTGLKGLGWNSEELKVFSIGTGTSFSLHMKEERSKLSRWGLIRWANQIPHMLTENNMEASEYYVSKVLPVGNYMRLQHDFSAISAHAEIGLDESDPVVIEKMKEKGRENFKLFGEKVVDFLNGKQLDSRELRKLI